MPLRKGRLSESNSWITANITGVAEKRNTPSKTKKGKTQNPSKTIRKRDIVLNYPIHDLYPLIGYLYVAPLGVSKTPLIKDAFSQVPVILRYKNLPKMYDLEITLLLYHQTKGQWPPFTYFLWKAKGYDEMTNQTIQTERQEGNL